MRRKSAPAPALDERNLPALPAGWAWATIEQINPPGRPCAYGVLQPGPDIGDGVPLIRVGDIRHGRVSTQAIKRIDASIAAQYPRTRVQGGEVVISLVGAIGRTGVVPRSLAGANTARAVGVIPVQAPILPSWVEVCLRSPAKLGELSSKAHEVARKTLNLEDVRRAEIPLPPVAEQLRIVAEIEKQFSRLDAGVAALERVRAGLKRYRAAVLQAACTGRLVPTEAELARAEGRDYEPAGRLLGRILAERRARWEEEQRAKMAAQGKLPLDGAWKAKYQEPALPDTTDVPDLPEGWAWASLGQCFTVHVGATPSRARPQYWNGEIPWVSSGEIQFCRIRETRERITGDGLRNSSTQVNPAGSVLLGMIGEGRTRGQVALLEIPACNNQNCAAIWVSQTPMHPLFVYYWLWSQYEVTRRGSSGNNQPALNKARVEQILLAIPPLAEQQRIVAEVERRLSVVDELEALVAANLKRAERLRQAILKRAFEGRLVPQDPNDEPASVLLERIRRERDALSMRRMQAGGKQ